MHKAPPRSLDRALVWFRRDLRAHDHAALYAACRAARQVLAERQLQWRAVSHLLDQVWQQSAPAGAW